MTSNDRQYPQPDDAFWTKESATAQEQQPNPTSDHAPTGYGYYGQDEPARQWAQPGAGYSEPNHWAQVSPYAPNPGQPQYAGQRFGPQHDHPSGTPSLVLGVLSMAVFPPLGYIALVMGVRGLRESRANPGVYRNHGILLAGAVLGGITSVICTIAITAVLMVLVAMVMA